MANKYLALKGEKFDINKITVVGSPTITSDGVASGFSSNDYVRTPALNFTQPFKLDFEFNTNTLNTEQYLLLSTSAYLWAFVTKNNDLYIRLGTTSWGGDIVICNYNGILANTNYKVSIKFNGATYEVFVNGNKVYQKNTTTTIPNSSVTVIIGREASTNYLRGTFNLIEFKYTSSQSRYSPTKPTYLLERRKPKVWNKGQFNIVGNPSISDDGIASGFSSGNYLQTPATIDFANANSWSLETSFITPNSFTAINSIYSGDISYNGIRFTINATGQLVVALSSVTTTYDIGAITGLQLTPNTKYWSRVKFTGSKYILEYSIDGKKYIETGTSIVSSTKIMSSVGKIGVNNNNSTPFLGSIDLSQFKIYTDNNLVFDGGADTYVYDPSKFTIVGSPTITEYGVASGFSNSNYIQVTTIDYSKNWEIVVPFKTGSTISAQVLLTMEDKTTSTSRYLVLTGAKTLSFRLAGLNLSNIDSTSLKENTDYIAKIGWDGSRYYLKISGQEYYRNSSTALEIDEPVKLGTINNSGWIFQGSIDLPSFSITVDGKEVFTGAKENYYMLRR